MNCPNGWNAPSVGYQNGCRCDRCKGWRNGINLRRRMRAEAIRASRRRPAVSYPVWTPRSATSFYREALDAIDGVAASWH